MPNSGQVDSRRRLLARKFVRERILDLRGWISRKTWALQPTHRGGTLRDHRGAWRGGSSHLAGSRAFSRDWQWIRIVELRPKLLRYIRSPLRGCPLPSIENRLLTRDKSRV